LKKKMGPVAQINGEGKTTTRGVSWRKRTKFQVSTARGNSLCGKKGEGQTDAMDLSSIRTKEPPKKKHLLKDEGLPKNCRKIDCDMGAESGGRERRRKKRRLPSLRPIKQGLRYPVWGIKEKREKMDLMGKRERHHPLAFERQ